MAKLSDAVIQELLENLSGWTLEGDTIKKVYMLHTFPTVISFVTHIGFLAEAAGHHPDMDIRYNRLTVALSTHDAGGLTQKDFDLAMQIDEIIV
ncbi:MAG: 4a-hydroxytetrahydrobiopterin dehydratase [Chloroflexaceae bacterium]|nr:4a-hydroxytetrahydrobiopterin dehydratase [Chloroflexaceae bacterium]NJO07106.1 4a-hydroxytetrahydrobiopterin dehydratase [Chloroflexaceae bacterium]